MPSIKRGGSPCTMHSLQALQGIQPSKINRNSGTLNMDRDEFFDKLWNLVKDSDVEFQELLDDDGEGGVYVKFSNIKLDED